jgi:hypothetical protein
MTRGRSVWRSSTPVSVGLRAEKAAGYEGRRPRPAVVLSGVGQQREWLSRLGANYAKVATVEGEQAVCPVSSGEHDQGGVCHSYVLVLVSLHDKGGISTVARFDIRQFPGSPGQLGQGGEFSSDSPAGGQEIVELRHHVRRNDEWTGIGVNDPADFGRMCVASVKICEERTRIAHEHG